MQDAEVVKHVTHLRAALSYNSCISEKTEIVVVINPNCKVCLHI